MWGKWKVEFRWRDVLREKLHYFLLFPSLLWRRLTTISQVSLGSQTHNKLRTFSWASSPPALPNWSALAKANYIMWCLWVHLWHVFNWVVHIHLCCLHCTVLYVLCCPVCPSWDLYLTQTAPGDRRWVSSDQDWEEYALDRAGQREREDIRLGRKVSPSREWS